jgi:hypothetical protein
VTDAHDWLPPHVCDAFFGHSETIFKENYGLVTEVHFRQVRERSSEVPQFAPQKTSAKEEIVGTEKKKGTPQNAEHPLLQALPDNERKRAERSRWSQKVKLGDEGLEPPTSTV